MVRETLRLLASPVRGMQAAVYVLAASALLSSLLALVRDRLFAHAFGAGSELDIYYAAFRVPDLIFVGIGSLVSVYILIPELARRGAEEQKRYLDTVIAGFSMLAVFLSLLAAALTPSLLSVLFPSLIASGEREALVLLTRIMLMQPVFLGLSNIFAAVTQARERYALYSLSPILYNFGIIAGLILFYPFLGLPGLAWGVVLGSALHMAIQIPSLVGDGYLRALPRIREPWALFETAAISIPRTLTLSMNQVAFLGLTAIASTLTAGSIAVFMFAFNLMSVPVAVIGASYSVAAFPTLASALSQGRVSEYIEYVSTAARYVLFWSLPSIVLIIVLRAHIVRVILGSGSFDWTDTRLTAAVFALLSVSLAAQGLMLLLARAYYAAGRTFVPFVIALVSAGGTIYLATVLVQLFGHGALLAFAQRVMRLEDVPGSPVLAVAVAYSLVSIAGTAFLMLHFEYRFGGFLSRIVPTLTQGTVAALGAGGAAYLALSIAGPLDLASTLLSVLLKGLAGGIVGILAAAGLYHLMRNREFIETAAALRAKIWREPLPKAQPLASAEEIGPSSPQ